MASRFDFWGFLGGVVAVVLGARQAVRSIAAATQPTDGLGRNDVAVRRGGVTTRQATVRNIDERVSHIKNLIIRGRYKHETIERARKIVSRKCEGDQWCVREYDWRGEIVAIFNWHRKNIRYVRDPYDMDLFLSSRLTVKYAAGDCDDVTGAIAEALQAIGFPVWLVVVQPIDKDDWSHIFLRTGYLDERGQWVSMALDCTVNQPAGWELPAQFVKRRKEYEIPGAEG